MKNGEIHVIQQVNGVMVMKYGEELMNVEKMMKLLQLLILKNGILQLHLFI